MTVDAKSLLALARVATPGPWHVELDGRPHADGSPRVLSVRGRGEIVDIGHGPISSHPTILETDGGYYNPKHPDAAYIAAASPEVVAALCERVEALEAALKEALELLHLNGERDDAEWARIAKLRALVDP